MLTRNEEHIFVDSEQHSHCVVLKLVATVSCNSHRNWIADFFDKQAVGVGDRFHVVCFVVNIRDLGNLLIL